MGTHDQANIIMIELANDEIIQLEVEPLQESTIQETVIEFKFDQEILQILRNKTNKTIFWPEIGIKGPLSHKIDLDMLI